MQEVPRIGLICDSGHDVFGTVADRLEERGYRVTFFEPGRPVDPALIDELTVLANKKVDPESFRALWYADQHGIATWNGYRTVILGARLLGLQALETAGFEVPRTTFQKPDGPYVAKPLFDWHYADDPELNGEGTLYQELLPSSPIDYKYYAVDDGRTVHVRVLRARSKLYGQKEPLNLVDPEPELVQRMRRLMRLVDAQAIGVDLVRSKGRHYAVDVNPAMSFRNAGMEDEITDSFVARVQLPVHRPTQSTAVVEK